MSDIIKIRSYIRAMMLDSIEMKRIASTKNQKEYFEGRASAFTELLVKFFDDEE